MAAKEVRWRLPVWKKLLFTAVVVVPALLALELLMRLAGCRPAPAPRSGPRVPPKAVAPDAFLYFAVCDAQLGFRNRSRGMFRSSRIEGNPVNTTDAMGYRNGFGWPGNGRSPIVVFVGDSITFCSEVNDEETGPSEVAKLLSKKFDVCVLNAGVRGYSTLQAKRMLARCFQRFPRIKVAVYTHCGNDYEENIVPNLRYPAKAPVVMRDAQTGEFREVEVTDPEVPYGTGFLEWRAPPPEPPGAGARLGGWFQGHSALWHHCAIRWGRIDFPARNRFEFPAKRPVSPEECAQWHEWALCHGGTEVMEMLLRQMDQMCREQGAAFLATCYFAGPSDAGVAQFAVECDRAGAQCVDLQEEFAGDCHSYISRRVDGRYDEHYGVRGTKAYAKALTPALEQILRRQ